MSIIKIRSPRYETLTTPSGALSAKLELSTGATVAGLTLKYTIVKSCTAGQTVSYEIAELVRDYLTPTITLDPANYPENQIKIRRVITFYDAANAGGSVVSGGNSVDYSGYDGYGTFMDGANPTISATDIVYLFTPEYKTGGNVYNLYVPEGEGGAFQLIDSSGEMGTQDFAAGDTSDTNRSVVVNFKRINCTKYGAGRKIVFINKWGGVQELWFFLKKVETTNAQSENYQRNLINTSDATNPTYDTKSHAITTFNKQAKQLHSLSSGYYPEWCNAWFEELILSEYVWMVRPKYSTPATNEIVPVTIKTSNLLHKTSVNDRLIEYTMEFEESFDYINNVR
jgi:hypothetical protein|tara:strand:+ start:2361 stop:3380 length:1020 start_codon:yes stop_codon:yes gene_type:complete